MPKSIRRKGVIAIALVLVAIICVASLAFFTDRTSHSMQFTTAKFTAEGYELTRTAPVGPFCAGEDVTATLKESNPGDDDANSVISMKATWVSPDTALSIFGNANNADNAKLSVDGANVSYKVSSDKRSITFDLPAHALAAGAKNVARDLTLTIPESFKSTGRIDFTFEKVVVGMGGTGFTKEFGRTDLNASSKLDYSVRVGWAASSIANQNGKALMGYLTDKNSPGKYGIEFEFAFNYNTSPMKDFASKTDAKWSYYKDKVDRLAFVEGMTSIGDYAFPDFELVSSLSLPESLASVGKWSFDNVSIPTLTLPAALTSFDTMSFGHINELTVITFQQAKNTSISFPTAGSTTGAFYVDPYVPTQIVGENPIAQGYDWITDQRRVAPVIRSYNYTWSGDRMSQPLDATTLTPDDNSNVDFHTAENRAKIKNIVFQNASGYYALPGMTPGDRNKVVEATANMWDVSAAQDKSVIAYLKSDGTLIIAADGVKVMANADSDWLFGDMANIETIDATLYDTSNATTLEYWHAFAEPDLKQGDGDWSGDPLPMEVPKRGTKQIVGIQNWNVSKVTSTRDMFYNANRLTSLNLGSWDTKSLKTPNGMFHGSSALTTLNVSGWNTSNVTTLQSIFSHCKALTALDVSGWDVRKVTDMSFAFSDCGAPVLDLHTWKTNSLYTLEKTFAGAAAKTINVAGWDTSKVIDMGSTFENTANVQALDLATWDTGAVGRGTEIGNEGNEVTFGTEAFNNMFYRSGAKSINVSGFDFRSFYGKGNWNGGLYNMFRECKNLTEIIGAETWTNTGKILQLYNTFQDCEKLVTLNVSTWDTSGVTSMANAFSGCKALAALDVSRWNVSSCETYINTFKDCASVKVLDISKWDMTKATPSASQNMFNGCKSLKSLTFPKAVNWLATSMAANCPKLTTIEFLSTDDSIIQRPLAGEKLGAFYVAPDAGVTVPVVTKVITHGTGMAQLKNSSTYNWADDNRCMAEVNPPKQNGTLTYDGSAQKPDWTGYDSAKMTIGGTQSGTNAGTYTAKFTPKGGYCWPDGTTDTVSVTWKINKATVSVPSQKGTLTYNGNAQTPSWNNYSTASLTLGGKTSGTNAGSYTATFTPTANYQWSDGTTAAKSVAWSIGKAAGSVTLSKSSATIDYNATTTTFTVTRAGDGVISVASSAPGVATATVSGNTVTVTKKGTGTATITVSVAEGTNHTAPANKTCAVTCKTIPTLAEGNTWYKGTAAEKTAITQIEIADTYSGAATKSWDASAAQDGSVKAYVNGTKLIIAGNGYGKVLANANSTSAFNAFTNVTSFVGLNKLDTSNITNMQTMFNNLDNIQMLDLSSFNTSKVTNFYSIFGGNEKLTTLNLTGWDTSAAKDMGQMFYVCNALTTIKGLDKFNTANVTDMNGMFHGCKAITSLDLRNFNTAKVKNMSYMFYQSSKLETVELSSFDTSNVTSMGSMFRYCLKLKTVTLGKSFKFVGTNGYLPEPSSIYISGATGNWYVNGLGNTPCYTPAQLAAVNRVRAVTYTAIPTSTGGGGGTGSEFDVNWPKQSGSLTYNGNAQSPSWSGYDTAKMTIGGTTSGTNAGTYTAKFTPKDGYCWPDGTADTVSVTWKIGKATVSVPSQKGTLTYTGNALSPSWNNYSSASLTLGGKTSGTNAGSYTATFTPTANYQWSDGTTTAKSVTWKINRAAVSVPSQSGTLTYNGNALTPSWSGYDSAKMTLGGTTSGTNAGTYTAKFTPTANYQWSDGTTAAKGVTWKIGKAAGSLSISKSSATIDYNATTTTFTVTRAGDGTISVASDNTNIATVSVNGNTVTVTKKGPGTAKITVFVAAGTNYTAPASKVCTVACKTIPTLAKGNTWYKGTAAEKTAITQIEIANTYSGTATKSWDASAAQDGSVKAYINGTKLIIAGNGYGKVMANADSSNAFNGFTGVTSFTGLNKLDTSKVTNMSYMFYNCSVLTSLDVSGFNTSNVTNMKSMFAGCNKLTSLDVSKFNTSKVTNMAGTFANCNKLTSLDVSKFNTSKVTDVHSMFYRCYEIKTLDLSSFDTSRVTNMKGMFEKCVRLQEVTLGKSFKFVGTDGYLPAPSSAYITGADGNWYDIADRAGYTPAALAGVTRTETRTYVADNKVPMLAAQQTWYKGTAAEKTAITQIEIADTYNGASTKSWDASAAQDGSVKAYINGTKLIIAGNGYGKVLANADSRSAFSGFTGVTSLTGLNKLDTSKVTNMGEMFYNCKVLTSLDVSGFNTSKVTNMREMFCACSALTSLDLSGWDTSKVTNMQTMFGSCYALTSLDVSGFNTSNVTNMRTMFYYCNALTSLDVSGFDTSNVTIMWEMFCACSALTSLDLSGFDTSKVTNMAVMFSECSALTSLDLSGWDTSKVTEMNFMFSDCQSLTTIDVSGFDTSNVTTMESMFDHCQALTSLDLSGFDTSKVTNMMSMFGSCYALTSLDLSGFDTSKVTNMAAMFASCSALTSLDLSGFDTSKVTSMDFMFRYCESLTTIYVSELWSTAKVTRSQYMFGNCSHLRNWSADKTDATYANYTSSGYLTYKSNTHSMALTSTMPAEVFDEETDSRESISVPKVQERVENTEEETKVKAKANAKKDASESSVAKDTVSSDTEPVNGEDETGKGSASSKESVQSEGNNASSQAEGGRGAGGNAGKTTSQSSEDVNNSDSNNVTTPDSTEKAA